MIVIGICALAGFLYLIWRFCQSRFTDERHLTFTLPVNIHQLTVAVIVNILRGTLLVFLAAAVYYGISLLQTIGMIQFGLGSDRLGPLGYGWPMNFVTIAAGYWLKYWLQSRKLNLT